MAQGNNKPAAGFVTFTLHSHLPYVVNHGTWPHGLDWLHEAAAETYLPLLRVMAELEQQGKALHANINLSPVLLEQLAHPTFQDAFGKYLQQKIDAAREDAQDFERRGEKHFVGVARFWMRFYEDAQRQFDALGRDIIGGFRHFYDAGSIEIITCGATHGYFALLGSDDCIRAQVRMGVATHQRFFQRKPRGIWLPECAYRPAGEWRYPVAVNGDGMTNSPFMRAGVEQILAENGLEYFFVDTHLVEKNPVFTPYDLLAGDVPIATEAEGAETLVSYYRPYYAGAPQRQEKNVAFFTRDPRTGVQVWSGDQGYPGEGSYLDFHKKRWPGGHRYWQVTSPKVDLGAKTAYYPEKALASTHGHAQHFAQITRDALGKNGNGRNGAPPILTAPFDAELFGHWWFEGPHWLKNVALEYAKLDSGIQMISCSDYLDRYRPTGFLSLPEGSWGRHGTHEVWLNPDTEWTWKHIYPAERAVQQLAEAGRWRSHEAATRLAKQICRELLLLESSDWQFLITTASARDYAEKRFHTHLEQFNTLLEGWRGFEGNGQISAETHQKLGAIEARDSIFPSITPDMWLPNS